MGLSNKHKKTPAAIFERPTRSDIRWVDIERLFVAAGAQVSQGSGSRVRIRLDDQVKTFRRPHPAEEARRYAVEAARSFLREHGVTP